MCGGGKVGPRSYFMGEDLNFISALFDSNLFNTVNTSCTVQNGTYFKNEDNNLINFSFAPVYMFALNYCGSDEQLNHYNYFL